ncbi:transposase family protein [Streptomyces sp. NPDC048384]|uniref:transposase family protein n=1 Tax=Streptomyces sp. NPDC048384 TaxID=3155487 RepID=UPI003424B8DD
MRANCCGSHPPLPGGTHDISAAREHGIAGACTKLDLDVLADRGHQGDGGTVVTPIKRRPGAELPDKHKRSNRAHARLRAPVERLISRIKQRRIFRHTRISPNRLTSAAASIPTLMIYRSLSRRLTVTPAVPARSRRGIRAAGAGLA